MAMQFYPISVNMVMNIIINNTNNNYRITATTTTTTTLTVQVSQETKMSKMFIGLSFPLLFTSDFLFSCLFAHVCSCLFMSFHVRS